MSSPNIQEVMEGLRQMQQSQDENLRILADENKDMNIKFTEFSEQVAYEANYMASTVDPAAPESQPISTLQDLVLADPPKFDGTPKHVTTFCNQVRSMLRLAPKRFNNFVQIVHYVGNLLTGPAYEWFSNYLDDNGDLHLDSGSPKIRNVRSETSV